MVPQRGAAGVGSESGQGDGREEMDTAPKETREHQTQVFTIREVVGGERGG